MAAAMKIASAVQRAQGSRGQNRKPATSGTATTRA